MTSLFIWLIVCIAILLVLIMELKFNASIALIIVSIFMGVAAKMPLAEITKGISSGFGGFMTGSGLPIGFGIILGQLLYDFGGANVIAQGIVRLFPRNKSLYAMALAALIISIPVFFDITFVLLIPLGIAIARENNIKLPYMVIAIVSGALVAHCLIPPTPGPLAAAQVLKLDVGIMIIGGVIIGAIAAFLGMAFMFRVMGKKGFWNQEKDESSEMQQVAMVNPIAADRKLPGVFVSLLPILVPVVLILMQTISVAAVGADQVPGIISFLGDKTVSMLLGVLCAMLIAKRNLSFAEIESSCNESIKSAGLVLLITGAGGAFGKILTLAGLPEAIVATLGQTNNAPMMLLLITYGIAMVLRIAQGSSTVAGITTLNIMAVSLSGVAIHPLWVAMAGMAGAFSIGHVNDSGFWIISKRTGLTVSGALKAVTLPGLIISLLVFALTLVGAVVLPTF